MSVLWLFFISLLDSELEHGSKNAEELQTADRLQFRALQARRYVPVIRTILQTCREGHAGNAGLPGDELRGSPGGAGLGWSATGCFAAGQSRRETGAPAEPGRAPPTVLSASAPSAYNAPMTTHGRIDKQVDRENVYYTLFWSPLAKADRHEIVCKVPSVAGIFELYYQDELKTLHLFFVSKAWYGGLRNWLRQATDPTLEMDVKRRQILEKYDCYYRYAVVDSYADLSDLMFFFADTYFPHTHSVRPSDRYLNIFVQEVSPEKIVTID
jgi:hypothetical protein